MKNSIKRTLIGFLLAPIVAPVLLTPVIAHQVPSSLEMQGFYFSTIGFMSYASMLLIGLPLHFVLWRLRKTSIVIYAITGCMVASFIIILMHVADVIVGLSIFIALLIPIGLVAGCLCSVCFWLIVRPDRLPALITYKY